MYFMLKCLENFIYFWELTILNEISYDLDLKQ